MTKEEFKANITRLISEYKYNKQYIDIENKKADEYEKYDPKLSSLLKAHVTSVEDIYDYLNKKAETQKQ